MQEGQCERTECEHEAFQKRSWRSSESFGKAKTLACTVLTIQRFVAQHGLLLHHIHGDFYSGDIVIVRVVRLREKGWRTLTHMDLKDLQEDVDNHMTTVGFSKLLTYTFFWMKGLTNSISLSMLPFFLFFFFFSSSFFFLSFSGMTSSR